MSAVAAIGMIRQKQAEAIIRLMQRYDQPRLDEFMAEWMRLAAAEAQQLEFLRLEDHV